MKEKSNYITGPKLDFLPHHPTHTKNEEEYSTHVWGVQKEIYPDVILPIRGKTTQCRPEHWVLDRKTINGQFVDIVKRDKREAAIWLNITGLRLYLKIHTRKSFIWELWHELIKKKKFSLIKQKNFMDMFLLKLLVNALTLWKIFWIRTRQ